MVLLFDGGGHEVGAQVGRDAVKAAHVHDLHPVGARLCMVLFDGSRHPGHLSCSVKRDIDHYSRAMALLCSRFAPSHLYEGQP